LLARRFDLPVDIVLNCAVAFTALRFSSASSSSSLFFSAVAASRTSLSSRSRSTIHCSFSVAFFSRSARLWACSTKDCHNTTRSSNSISTRHHPEKTRRRQLTVSALLMVTMLVRKACISSLSSKMSSFQGVRFQLIFRRGNLRLEDED
jgi:hypothetical protein